MFSIDGQDFQLALAVLGALLLLVVIPKIKRRRGREEVTEDEHWL